MSAAASLPHLGHGQPPIDSGPVLLLMSFGFHLAHDTLPYEGLPPVDDASPPSLDITPLIRAAEGLEPSRTTCFSAVNDRGLALPFALLHYCTAVPGPRVGCFADKWPRQRSHLEITGHQIRTIRKSLLSEERVRLIG
jgi:hypothetical protein